MPVPFPKKLAAEVVGTYFLVFAGTAAIVVNKEGPVTHVGISLVFGLIVFAMIAAIGDVSGAHINPAATIMFWLARRFPGRAVIPYILSQCAGAILASATVKFLFPDDLRLGSTLPAHGAMQSWVLELILTNILMFVVLSVSTGAREKGITAGIAIGGVVALEALFAGPISGASMNPARSLGPAVVSGRYESLWIYLTATTAGAALAVPLCWLVRDDARPEPAAVEAQELAA
jgi:aquaporin Z